MIVVLEERRGTVKLEERRGTVKREERRGTVKVEELATTWLETTRDCLLSRPASLSGSDSPKPCCDWTRFKCSIVALVCVDMAVKEEESCWYGWCGFEKSCGMRGVDLKKVVAVGCLYLKL
ncbi:hypothetical protein J1614_000698 [Plenodomus biglobosus]|nr:hypothetical protein J1614_000698 [Plenodomus biglobosus]